jgi:hypothetical protein
MFSRVPYMKFTRKLRPMYKCHEIETGLRNSVFFEKFCESWFIQIVYNTKTLTFCLQIIHLDNIFQYKEIFQCIIFQVYICTSVHSCTCTSPFTLRDFEVLNTGFSSPVCYFCAPSPKKITQCLQCTVDILYVRERKSIQKAVCQLTNLFCLPFILIQCTALSTKKLCSEFK